MFVSYMVHHAMREVRKLKLIETMTHPLVYHKGRHVCTPRKHFPLG
jgi:hypothetical protein